MARKDASSLRQSIGGAASPLERNSMTGLTALRLLQRQVGEGKGGQQPDPGRNQQAAADMQGQRQLDADGLAHDRQRQQRRPPADQQADADADRGQHRDLRKKVHEDARTAGAHRAQDGDDAGALGDIGGNAGPHADAADQQRGEPDDDEEAHEQVIVAHHGPEPVARRAHRPAALVERRSIATLPASASPDAMRTL
jgi:hypothetical protein